MTGIFSLVILITGMGLAGMQHIGFPPWVWGKIAIWAVLTGFGHMVAKRFPEIGLAAYWFSMILASMAAFLALTHS